MGKRFVDTELYDQEWFLALPPRLKCAWNVLCARCNVIGIWHISMTKLAFEVGEAVTLEELQNHFKVQLIDDDKLFIPGFVSFQYGDEAGRLSPKNKFHLSIANKLQALGLPDPDWKVFDTLPDGSGHPVDPVSTPVGSTQGRGEGEGEGKGQGNSSFEKGSGEKLFASPQLQDVFDALPIVTRTTIETKYSREFLVAGFEECVSYYANDAASEKWKPNAWGKKLTTWLIEKKRRDPGMKAPSTALADLDLDHKEGA